MKWNWGTGLVVGMLFFMAFILYFVITMSTNKKYHHDLVTENYYAKEIVYQNEIDQENNLKTLSSKITGKKTEKGWLLSFPDEISNNNSKGTVFLYRPSNKKLDFEIPMEISDFNVLIPNSKLIEGRWNITIQWETNGKPYIYKKSILY